MSDRIVMIAVIAALVAERLWSVPEPATHDATVHVYYPTARMYVRRCVAEGKDFVFAQADGGPWKAWCVTTPSK